VSESVLEHGYIPEEHAPDPVASYGDPTPPGKVAVWLFLASEIMFFIGILGSYVILRSGAPRLFESHAQVLSKPLAGLNTLVLIFSSLTMALSVEAAQRGDRQRLIKCLAVTLACAFGFMVIKAIEYADKANHHTLVYNDPDTKQAFALDGHVHAGQGGLLEFEGYRMPLPDRGFDIHLASEHDIKAAAGGKKETLKLDPKHVGADVVYGPWKNIFFSCYYALTGIHGLHVIGGIIPLVILLVQAIRGKILPGHTEYVGLYWHFVDLVWIFLFPLLYLI
jgi:cytochrome c oxidase subunit 3